ncbi:Conserved_hypothetical protein [Hexamita inflata]|uniref:Uncharacterized protein n=1 Tax=Hexamita inflata TaxID=28002 RepID=A0AA86P243_9EUKA|nr:Conserved hypothetical protein [Hexamita inflata]
MKTALSTKILSTKDFYAQFRPPFYYKQAATLTPPEIPEYFEPMRIMDKATRCEPHGTQRSLLSDPNAITINRLTNELDHELYTNEQLAQILNQYPQSAPESKQYLKILISDYLAQVSAVLDEVTFSQNNQSEPAELRAEKQRKNLCDFIDVLKQRQGKVLLKRELLDRIDKKKQMVKMMQKCRENVGNGVETLSNAEFPK